VPCGNVIFGGTIPQQNLVKLNKIYQGDCLTVLKTFPDCFIDCIVSSPPYWALRDYGVKEQLGLEKSFAEYIIKLCDRFDECKRVLKDTGTCWVNLGDTYYSLSGGKFLNDNISSTALSKKKGIDRANALKGGKELPQKNLTLVPFRFALEMQRRGWIIRNVIIWHRPNSMPSSVQDRFTVDFEYVFFFVKNKKYWFKRQLEPLKASSINRLKHNFNINKGDIQSAVKTSGIKRFQERFLKGEVKGRNKRCVWSIPTRSFHGNHFAVYPEELVLPMIKAGCPENGIVLDPFCGSGTTLLAAKKLHRRYIGIEINPTYVQMAEERIKNTMNNLF